MATLATVAANVTDLLRRPNDSDILAKAKLEIAHAVRHYNRRVSWLVEHRGGTITASNGTQWYSTIDLTAGADIEDADEPSGTLRTSTDSLQKMLAITYAKLEQGTVDWPLDVVTPRDFERLSETSGVTGTPRWITYHVGKVGLWPVPGATYTVYVSGFFKPGVPTSDSDESVWFDNYLELIENAAARRVAGRWLHDTELAQVFAMEEGVQERQLLAENAAKLATGKLRSTEI